MFSYLSLATLFAAGGPLFSEFLSLFLPVNAILPNIRERIAQTAVNIDRSFASFGSYSMALPYSRYIEKYLLNMGKELLEDVLVSDADDQLVDWSNALAEVSPHLGPRLS